MTTSIVLHNYFYRYRQKRKNVKQLVDSTNYSQAKTQLENDIAEQETHYPNIGSGFNFGENIILKNSLIKLNVVIDQNDPLRGTGLDENDIYVHQSDRLKTLLEHQPKSDYTDTD